MYVMNISENTTFNNFNVNITPVVNPGSVFFSCLDNEPDNSKQADTLIRYTVI